MDDGWLHFQPKTSHGEDDGVGGNERDDSAMATMGGDTLTESITSRPVSLGDKKLYDLLHAIEAFDRYISERRSWNGINVISLFREMSHQSLEFMNSNFLLQEIPSCT